MPRPRTWLFLLLLILGAGLSAGFVPERLAARRSRATRVPSDLAFESLLSRLAGSPVVGRRLARRDRAAGWAGRRGGGLKVQRIDLEREAHEDGRAGLSPGDIAAVIQPHDAKLGQCLLLQGEKRLHLRLVIRATGAPVKVTTNLHGKAEACVTAIVNALRFPPFKGNDVTGAYQLVLQ
jgi:hypothetical protein